MTKKAIKKIHSYLHVTYVSSFQAILSSKAVYPNHKTQTCSPSSHFLFHFLVFFVNTQRIGNSILHSSTFFLCVLLTDVVLNIHLHYVYICDVYVFFVFLNNAAAISSPCYFYYLLTNDNIRKAETKLKRYCANLRFLGNEHFPECTSHVRSPTEDKNTSQRSKEIGSPSSTTKGLG